MPVNAMLIRALLQFYLYYGDNFKVECPTGSGVLLNLQQVADEIAGRLVALFLPDSQGKRPCHGEDLQYASDPHWKNLVLFYEYFHGDTGRGCGASHQTGWTGIIGRMLRSHAKTPNT